MKTVGEKIRMRRNELGWSMRELADKMGYKNQSAISRIENGTRDIPQSKLVEFANVMRTTVGYLMDWEEENSVVADITVRMRTDDEFVALIQNLNALNPEQLASVKRIVEVMLMKK